MVPAVVQQGPGAEFGVGRFGFEGGGGGEDVETVAVFGVAGGCGLAVGAGVVGVFSGAEPVGGALVVGA